MRHDTRRPMVALLVGAFVALATVLAPSATAAAPGYPVDICATVSVSTTTPRVGEAVEVTAVNFLPNRDVPLVLKAAPGNNTDVQQQFKLKTVRTSANGTFTTTFVMPNATANEGPFALIATAGSPSSTNCPPDPLIVLTAAGDGPTNNNGGPDSGPGQTAFTGLNVLLLLLVAAVLIAIGIAATRRGRRSTTDAGVV